MSTLDWNKLTLSEVRDLDETDLAAIPAELIPVVCAKVDAFRKFAINLEKDCGSLMTVLNQRAFTELLGDADEAKYPAGKFKKSSTDYMALPKATEADGGGWTAVFTECIRRVNEDNIPVDEAFSWINFQRLNAKAFADIEDNADLPIGISRSTKILAKFTATKPKL